MKSKLLLVILLLTSFLSANAQQNGFNYNSTPKEYIIGGITVSGVKFLNKQAIVQISGLKVGQSIKIPGDQISRSIEKLWKQGLFSDVSIGITSISGDNVYLDIKLEERPKLSKVEYRGVRNGEKNDISEKVKLTPGTKVTEHVITNTKNIIEGHFYEKGYYNVDVRITQVTDTMMQNVVKLIINVDKGHKVKIREIVPEGNVQFADKKVRKALKNTKKKRWYGMFKPSKFVRTKFEEDKVTLIKKFNKYGYRDAQILGDSVYRINDKLVGVKISLEEGHQYYYRSISWVGNTKYSSDLLQRKLDIKKGDLYDQNRLDDRLNNDLDAVGNVYLDDGYLFFRAMPRETAVINDSIDVEIMIVEGPQAYINRINISGNTRTNDHVARRELYTLPGELFSRTDIINSVRELANLGNFDPPASQEFLAEIRRALAPGDGLLLGADLVKPEAELLLSFPRLCPTTTTALWISITPSPKKATTNLNFRQDGAVARLWAVSVCRSTTFLHATFSTRVHGVRSPVAMVRNSVYHFRAMENIIKLTACRL